MTTDPAFLALLQLTDGLFPAGGFAHSFGLETYVQEGRVDDAAGPQALRAPHPAGGAGPRGPVAAGRPTQVAAPPPARGAVGGEARAVARRTGPRGRAPRP